MSLVRTHEGTAVVFAHHSRLGRFAARAAGMAFLSVTGPGALAALALGADVRWPANAAALVLTAFWLVLLRPFTRAVFELVWPFSVTLDHGRGSLTMRAGRELIESSARIVREVRVRRVKPQGLGALLAERRLCLELVLDGGRVVRFVGDDERDDETVLALRDSLCAVAGLALPRERP